MDQKDTNTPHSHSTSDPSTSNSNLCNENGDSDKGSANVVDNEKNNDRSSKNEISPSKPQILKRMREKEETETKMAANATDQVQSPDIHKLPIELLVNLFDYLPLKDLCSVRQTSKWFHHVTGFCFQKNYSVVVRYLQLQKDIELSAFHQLIQTVKIQGKDRFNNYNQPEYYFKRLSEFQQLKALKLACLSLTDFENFKIEDLKEMLAKIEYLEIYGLKFTKEFTENIPFLFPNLKHLSMQNRQPRSEWIACKFPKLECFELSADFESVAIGPFLKINPNIRKLAITAKCLWTNRESMKAAKLEDLTITAHIPQYRYAGANFWSIVQLLNELHELGSYQRLKLCINFEFIKEDQLIEMASLRALVKVHIGQIIRHINPIGEDPYSERFALSAIRNLEEIHANNSYDINDIEAAADNLENLEHIKFMFADLDDLIPFIKRARKLKTITVTQFIRTASRIRRTNEKIYWIYRGDEAIDSFTFEKQKVINLSSLNAERAKLPNVKMVTFYVKEGVYLATKWAMNETDFEFIQLKRNETFQFDHSFGL